MATHSNILSWRINSMSGGVWWVVVHGITRSWTQLSGFYFQSILRAGFLEMIKLILYKTRKTSILALKIVIFNLFIYLFYFNNIVLVLPYIDLNPPWMCMCFKSRLGAGAQVKFLVRKVLHPMWQSMTPPPTKKKAAHTSLQCPCAQNFLSMFSLPDSSLLLSSLPPFNHKYICIQIQLFKPMVLNWVILLSREYQAVSGGIFIDYYFLGDTIEVQ